MTAICELCHELVENRAIGPCLDPDNAEACYAHQLQEFDLLAAAMLNHIHQRHREETLTCVAVGHLAAKVLAMTYAESAIENYQAMRMAWRKGLVTELSKRTAQAEAGEAS